MSEGGRGAPAGMIGAMMTDGRSWCRWDEADWNRFDVAAEESYEEILVRRAGARTAVFERVLGWEGSDEGEYRRLCDAAAAEYRRRIQCWSPGARSWRGPLKAAWIVLAVLGLPVVALELATGNADSACACSFLALMPAMAVIAIGILISRPTELLRALNGRKCPDCGYELRGLPSAIAEADLRGLWIGPRLCPECAALWPMVPSEVERLDAKAAAEKPAVVAVAGQAERRPDARPSSVWETLPLSRDELADVRPAVSPARLAAKCRRRVGIFEAFCAAQEAGNKGGGSALAATYRDRRDRWLTMRGSPATGGAGLILVTGILIGGCFGSLVLFDLHGVAFLVLLAWPVVIVYLAWRMLGRPLSALERFKRGRCVDCGYDLRDLPPAIEPGLVEGLAMGPRVCPECGAPWPMVPPEMERVPVVDQDGENPIHHRG